MTFSRYPDRGCIQSFDSKLLNLRMSQPFFDLVSMPFKEFLFIFRQDGDLGQS